MEKKHPKHTDWVKAFVEDHPTYFAKKEHQYFPKAKAMQEARYFKTILRLKTFLMAAEMESGYYYSLAIPHMAFLYQVLGDICEVSG